MSAIRLEGPVAVVRTPARFGFASDLSVLADIDALIAAVREIAG